MLSEIEKIIKNIYIVELYIKSYLKLIKSSVYQSYRCSVSLVLSAHGADSDAFVDHHLVKILLLSGFLPKLDLTGGLHHGLVIAVLILLLYLREVGFGVVL